jgi:hypothetical protein
MFVSAEAIRPGGGSGWGDGRGPADLEALEWFNFDADWDPVERIG